jgi:hypothetical protein
MSVHAREDVYGVVLRVDVLGGDDVAVTAERQQFAASEV